MSSKTDAEVAALERMTTGQLVAKYEETFGESTRSRQRLYLIRRIAWRIQSLAEGDLTERARQRAAELARDADVRVTSPRPTKIAPASPVVTVPFQRDPRLPPPGTEIVRDYKGRKFVVIVRDEGFEWQGEQYKSLTAIAKAITGQHVSGFAFFRMEAK